jgi:hypothetical protein
VVAIRVETTRKTLVFSGTVLGRRQDFLYIVTVSKIREHIDNDTIKETPIL